MKEQSEILIELIQNNKSIGNLFSSFLSEIEKLQHAQKSLKQGKSLQEILEQETPVTIEILIEKFQILCGSIVITKFDDPLQNRLIQEKLDSAISALNKPPENILSELKKYLSLGSKNFSPMELAESLIQKIYGDKKSRLSHELTTLSDQTKNHLQGKELISLYQKEIDKSVKTLLETIDQEIKTLDAQREILFKKLKRNYPEATQLEKLLSNIQYITAEKPEALIKLQQQIETDLNTTLSKKNYIVSSNTVKAFTKIFRKYKPQSLLSIATAQLFASSKEIKSSFYHVAHEKRKGKIFFAQSDFEILFLNMETNFDLKKMLPELNDFFLDIVKLINQKAGGKALESKWQALSEDIIRLYEKLQFMLLEDDGSLVNSLLEVLATDLETACERYGTKAIGNFILQRIWALLITQTHNAFLKHNLKNIPWDQKDNYREIFSQSKDWALKEMKMAYPEACTLRAIQNALIEQNNPDALILRKEIEDELTKTRQEIYVISQSQLDSFQKKISIANDYFINIEKYEKPVKQYLSEFNLAFCDLVKNTDEFLKLNEENEIFILLKNKLSNSITEEEAQETFLNIYNRLAEEKNIELAFGKELIEKSYALFGKENINHFFLKHYISLLANTFCISQQTIIPKTEYKKLSDILRFIENQTHINMPGTKKLSEYINLLSPFQDLTAKNLSKKIQREIAQPTGMLEIILTETVNTFSQDHIIKCLLENQELNKKINVFLERPHAGKQHELLKKCKTDLAQANNITTSEELKNTQKKLNDALEILTNLYNEPLLQSPLQNISSTTVAKKNTFFGGKKEEQKKEEEKKEEQTPKEPEKPEALPSIDELRHNLSEAFRSIVDTYPKNPNSTRLMLDWNEKVLGPYLILSPPSILDLNKFYKNSCVLINNALNIIENGKPFYSRGLTPLEKKLLSYKKEIQEKSQNPAISRNKTN